MTLPFSCVQYNDSVSTLAPTCSQKIPNVFQWTLACLNKLFRIAYQAHNYDNLICVVETLEIQFIPTGTFFPEVLRSSFAHSSQVRTTWGVA